MNYKIEGAIKKNRTKFLVSLILWLILVIVFVVPFSYSVYEAGIDGSFSLEIFMEELPKTIMNPFLAIAGIFKYGLIGDLFRNLLMFSIFYFVCFFIGFSKSAPKSAYSDIEHGSSDWSQRGEQYKILSKNKGIILAENNYLPLDKRGNVNVLVVGRIWFW